MTRNAKNYRQFLQAPIGGVDFRQPLFNMPPTISPLMFNFVTENARLRKRPPHTQYIDGDPLNTGVGTVYPGYYVQPGVGGTTNGTATADTPASILPGSDYTFFRGLKIASTFEAGPAAGVVYSLTGSAPPVWGAGLTFPAVAGVDFYPITGYRQRLYVGTVTPGARLAYGGVDAVAGVMSTFDPSSLMSGSINDLATLSISSGFAPEHYLVIASDRGDILVYAGSYPGGTDWQLVTRFQIDTPAVDTQIRTLVRPRFIQLVEIPNDVLINVITSTQMFSLRELMATGVATDSKDILAPVRPLVEDFGPRFPVTTPLPSRIYKLATYQPFDNSVITTVFTTSYNRTLFPWSSTSPSYFAEPAILSGALSGQTYIIKSSIADNVHTIHDLRYLHGLTTPITVNGSAIAPIFAGNAAGPFGSAVLFNYSSSDQTDYALYGSGEQIYTGMAKFAPLPPPYKNKKVNNALLYSNLYNDHLFSYQAIDQFNIDSTTFFPQETDQTATNIKATVLDGYGVGNTNTLGILENSDANVPFEAFGLDVLYEEGGEW